MRDGSERVTLVEGVLFVRDARAQCLTSWDSFGATASLILRLMRAFPRPDFVTFVRPGACVSAKSRSYQLKTYHFAMFVRTML